LFFQRNPVLRLYFLVAGQRHHGYGRKNALTREAVAKVVDDTYRLDSICSPNCQEKLHNRWLMMSDEVVDLVSFDALMLPLSGKCKFNVLLT